MDSTDKEERKREYNRLAQREFRRRRKEHLRSLEQAQKELSSERAEEINRLRSQNNELRKENIALRAQIYSSSNSNQQLIPPAPILDNRQYSLSPSLSGNSMSGNASSPSAMVGSDYMPMTGMSLGSSSMMTPTLHSFSDHDLSTQPYSLVHYPGIRHSAQSSSESSGYRSTSNTLGSYPFQSVKVEGHEPTSILPTQRQSCNLPALTMTIPYDRNRARSHLSELFKPLLSLLPSIESDPQKHSSMLQSMTDLLPESLKPTKLQIETAHFYGIDMVASPSLRDRLLVINTAVARNFIDEVGFISADHDDTNALTIWGDDPLNEMFWEFSRATLERWGWVLGSDWVHRSNFWRKEKGLDLIPNW